MYFDISAAGRRRDLRHPHAARYLGKGQSLQKADTDPRGHDGRYPRNDGIGMPLARFNCLTQPRRVLE
jgi:hypothetical protein